MVSLTWPLKPKSLPPLPLKLLYKIDKLWPLLTLFEILWCKGCLNPWNLRILDLKNRNDCSHFWHKPNWKNQNNKQQTINGITCKTCGANMLDCYIQSSVACGPFFTLHQQVLTFLPLRSQQALNVTCNDCFLNCM